jgi:indole-3-glycerol phosphate synthase
MILDKIVEQKKIDIEEFKKNNNLEEIMEKARNAKDRPSFKEALAKKSLSIIGELKKASPSKGVIIEEFYPEELLPKYETSVDAISILTEEKFFMGKAHYLWCASKTSKLPLLRKDFIIDEIQIYEAKMLGASAILLICAILTKEELKKYIELAKELRLDVLVESHDKKELMMALEAGAEIVGINNRNLNDFTLDINTTLNLLELIPEGKIVVSESGFNTVEDIAKIKGHRVDAILVGESFMRAEDIKKHAEKFRAAFGG